MITDDQFKVCCYFQVKVENHSIFTFSRRLLPNNFRDFLNEYIETWMTGSTVLILLGIQGLKTGKIGVPDQELRVSYEKAIAKVKNIKTF